MHLPHNPQCTIQNRNVYISVLNGALLDMAKVHCGICEIGLLFIHDTQRISLASHDRPGLWNLYTNTYKNRVEKEEETDP